MFGLFDTINSREKQDELIFQLSESIQVSLSLADPPYYSRFYLHRDGEEIADVSVSSDSVEKIKKYFDRAQTNKIANESFLLELNNLGLSDFAAALGKNAEETVSGSWGIDSGG
ncbi:hypothetical protein [Legionella spiritensis]|uniref:Uncharacterized protein n=1 Tax=Legionella spiritensis TaxID=452 RepID=A0A0W0Z436_LEGSP|nr:hypothetical protein [Legionella spiritensis]KTD63912.1 hypothetical protein Lspi_1431 [Legionella spiritensis]SNV36477.1 Uncharacterised protein [Legionella spiritensis]